MPTEKTQEARTSAERHTELISSRLIEFLSIRFDHAGRINPRIKAIKQDLIYHEMANVRRCLMGDKIYGPLRRKVSDVLLGDDEKIRKLLMSPTDQTSIQVELVSHCQDQRKEATRGQVRIHDLKAFYSSIEPWLADFMDLIETWIWWDIYDAAEQVRFEQKLGMIAHIRQGRLTPELRKRYASLIHVGGTDDGEGGAPVTVGDDEVIKYELAQLERIRDQWAYRRADEHGYMFILKRDELASPSQGTLIHRIADKVREYDMVDRTEALDEEMRHRYAIELKILPDKVTRELVLEMIQTDLIALERESLKQADHDTQLGPPYNYKARLLEMMERKVAELAQSISPGRAAEAPVQ